MRLHAYIPIWCTMLLSCVATPPTVRTAPLALPGLPLPSRGLPAARLIRSDIPARVIELEMSARYTPGTIRVSAVHHVTLPVLERPTTRSSGSSARAPGPGGTPSRKRHATNPVLPFRSDGKPESSTKVRQQISLSAINAEQERPCGHGLTSMRLPFRDKPDTPAHS